MITVIGGGIAGLAAAYELQRRGAEFRLLEASPRFGGILRTDYADNLVIDAGPDAMLARKPAGIDLCRDLGIAGRLVSARPPRTAFVVRDGRLEPLPDAGQVLRSRLLSDVGPEPPTPHAWDESIAAFFARQFGREALDYFAEPVLAGIHAGDVHRLSIRALFPEMLEEPAAPRPVDSEGAFRSFPRGMQELVDALVSAIPRERLRLNERATAIALEGKARWIVATPAHAAALLLERADGGLAAMCRSIRYVSSGIAVLAYPRDRVRHALAGGGFVVPRVERGARILAATWLSSKWPGRAPDDVALMRAFFGGARDPGAMALTDTELVEVAHADLARLLDIQGAPRFSRVYRWIDGTPQYEVGYLDTLAAIGARAAKHQIQLIGAGFGAIGIPDCIAAGREAARAALI
jgi:oxygen-dependent protoporphyrinogen oxidase